MKVVRCVRHRRSTFTTTGIASVHLRPWQSVSTKLPLARSIAFRLARRLAQLECLLKKHDTVPELVRVINVAVRRERHELSVAITVRWRCTRRVRSHGHHGTRNGTRHYSGYAKGNRRGRYVRFAECDCSDRYRPNAVRNHNHRYNRYNWHSWPVCPYLYPDCWSCPRSRACIVVCRPRFCTLGRQLAIALKRGDRQWRRCFSPTTPYW
jgi:hypothetical protein